MFKRAVLEATAQRAAEVAAFSGTRLASSATAPSQPTLDRWTPEAAQVDDAWERLQTVLRRHDTLPGQPSAEPDEVRSSETPLRRASPLLLSVPRYGPVKVLCDTTH